MGNTQESDAHTIWSPDSKVHKEGNHKDEGRKAEAKAGSVFDLYVDVSTGKRP